MINRVMNTQFVRWDMYNCTHTQIDMQAHTSIGLHVQFITHKFILFLMMQFPNSLNQTSIKCKHVACISGRVLGLYNYQQNTFYQDIQFFQEIFNKNNEIENVMVHEWLPNITSFSFLEKVINENNKISSDPMRLSVLLLYKTSTCSEPNWISWLIHQLLTFHSTNKNRTSLPAT